MTNTNTKKPPKFILDVTHKAISARKLSLETTTKWNYGSAKYNGKTVQVASYYSPTDRSLVAQKLRTSDKQFICIGNPSELLFGRNLWQQGGRMVVLTEGEIDALSVSQIQGNKYPVVSLPNGAGSAVKAITANMEWLCSFEKVILMFDMDEPGREATETAAMLLPPGKAWIAELPLKDPSELLVTGRAKEISDAIWRAKSWRPDGIVTPEDIMEEALAPVTYGYPWWMQGLTKATVGRQLGSVEYLGAGTGIGKTDFITQQVAFDITKCDLRPALFFLEQVPTETLARVAGKIEGTGYHIPNFGWTDEGRKKAFEALSGHMFLYDNFGFTEWDAIKSQIRYLAHAEKVTTFYIDHLTALADTSNERESLEQITKEIAMLAKELNVWILVVSHLSTPDGKPHEEGGRVTIRNFKGSRAIGFWAYFMYGLERNQQADDPEDRHKTTVRVLKDRHTGQSVGQTFTMKYDQATTRLIEVDPDNHFGDEDENEQF